MEKNIQILNTLLANEMVLYIKLYNYHWNVKGIDFISLHSFFQEQYDQVISFVDTLAERIRALEGTPISTMREFLDCASLQEGNSSSNAQEMVSVLLGDHKTISKAISKMFNYFTNEGDDGTANMLLDFQAAHDKNAWKITALLG